MKKLFLPLIIVALALTSCGKYDDGPEVSVIPRSMRLAREWSYEKKYINEVEVELSSSEADDYLSFSKENDFAMVYVSGATETRAEGTWQWRSDQEEVEVNYTFIINFTQIYKVLRLTTKELWYSYQDNNQDTFEYHMIARD